MIFFTSPYEWFFKKLWFLLIYIDSSVKITKFTWIWHLYRFKMKMYKNLPRSKPVFIFYTFFKGEIPNITNLATATALNGAENNIPSVSNLVQKTHYNTKISEIEKKITDHDHDNSRKFCCKISTSKFRYQKWYCWFRKKDRFWW